MSTPKKDLPAETPGYIRQKDLASLLDITTRWAQELTRRGILKKYRTPAGDRYQVVKSVKAYVKFLTDQAVERERQAAASPWDETKAKAEADLAESKAAVAKLHVKELRAKYHDAALVEAFTEDLIQTITEKLNALPRLLAADLSIIRTAPEASIRIEAECHRILE